MKKIAPRSLAPLLAAAALPFTPVVAQEVPAPTVQAPPAAEPAPAPAPAAAPATVFAAPKPVVQAAPPPGPQAEDLARQAQADAAARQSTRRPAVSRAAPAPIRTARVVRPQANSAPAAAAPSTAPAPAPAAVLPNPTPTVTPAEAPTIAVPAPDATPVAAQTSTTTTTTGINWLWVGLAAVAIAALGALLFFRRRRDEEVYYDEPAYVEEPAYADVPTQEAEVVPVAAPMAAAAVADRPQIELGIRPIRAGSDNGQARVDYEVIVENAGALDARDVTVTSWLLNAESSEAETAIIENHIDVAAGEVATVTGSATVVTDRSAFRPIVATDARYALPDGTQGYIAARFAVGVDGGEPGRITPIVLGRDELREDLGSRLEGEVERA